MNIIFCGLPSVGKTTYGKQLAKKLSRLFIDTDDLIEELYDNEYQEKLNCREIYKKLGEQKFREMERVVVASLIRCHECVIATGGGTFLDPKNVNVLKSIGRIIYLKMDQEDLINRIMEDGLPAFCSSEKVLALFLKERTPQYENAADMTIEVKDGK